jgi:dephospho-CoA kinase
MSLRVGLTGGLASGKTAVAQMFASRGAYLMHADKVAHELMQPDQPIYEEVVRHFGHSIVNADRTINRPILAALAFEGERVKELNAIVHPGVTARMQQWFAEMNEFDPKGVLVFEAALILEAGMGKYFEKLVVVTSNREQKLERFAQRVLGTSVANTEELEKALRDAERRLGAQLSQSEKVAAADYVIDNSGSLAETERQVHKIFKELQMVATSSPTPSHS